MVADGLTKDDGPASDVIRVTMRHSMYKIGSEEEALERNREEKERRLARGRERQAKALQDGTDATEKKKLLRRRNSFEEKKDVTNQLPNQKPGVAAFQ